MVDWKYSNPPLRSEHFVDCGPIQLFLSTFSGKKWKPIQVAKHQMGGGLLTVSQTSSFLYVGSQKVDGQLVLNQVSKAVETDLSVTNVGARDVAKQTALVPWTNTILCR